MSNEIGDQASRLAHYFVDLYIARSDRKLTCWSQNLAPAKRLLRPPFSLTEEAVRHHIDEVVNEVQIDSPQVVSEPSANVERGWRLSPFLGDFRDPTP